eukprot:TRINITY_DN23473_c0_g1_i1.p1 TRINITY_DN23473_c0_g1~~TRINITY_DN23473_c0_g1_i1.p1  ORF type:complete len:281 (+),score=25.24 TRINITY_DN23473_c0_g1_i1:1545-2387(+)
MVRGCIHTMRHLMPQLTKAEKVLDRPRAKVQRLEKNSHRNMERDNCIAKIRWALLIGGMPTAISVPLGVQRTIFKRRGATWKNMSSVREQQHDRRCVVAAAAFAEKNRDAKANVVNDIRCLRDQIEEEKTLTKPLLWSAFQFSKTDLLRLDEKLQFTTSIADDFSLLQARAALQLSLATQTELDRLQSVPTYTEPPVAQQLWLCVVAYNRGKLAGSMLAMRGIWGTQYYKFTVAIDRTYRARFPHDGRERRLCRSTISPLCLGVRFFGVSVIKGVADDSI